MVRGESTVSELWPGHSFFQPALGSAVSLKKCCVCVSLCACNCSVQMCPFSLLAMGWLRRFEAPHDEHTHTARCGMGSGWWDLVGDMYGYGEGVSCLSEHMAWPMLFQTALGSPFVTLSLGKKCCVCLQ